MGSATVDMDCVHQLCNDCPDELPGEDHDVLAPVQGDIKEDVAGEGVSLDGEGSGNRS